jgi:hypothetical protein
MASPPITLATRLVASPDQVSANVAGESVILGMKDAMYYGLDPVGTRIWELLQKPAVLDDVLGTITAEFEVTREQAAADLLAFAADLHAHGLVEIAEP